MSQLPDLAHTAPLDITPTANGLHSVLRFLRTVRYRKGVMIFCIFLAGALGMLYFATATRFYQSSADLYVQRIGSGVTTEAGDPAANPTKDMPTFQKIMRSEVVISQALSLLNTKQKVDLKRIPKVNWVSTMQKALSVRSARQTNVLELSYRSRDPEAAAAVLRAILVSYQDFLNNTHRGTSDNNMSKLEEKQEEIRQDIERKKNDLYYLTEQAQGYIDGATEGGGFSIPALIIQKLVDDFQKARDERLRAQSMVNDITNAIQNGQDVLQFALTSVDALGQQMIEELFGLGASDALYQARINQDILDVTSELREAENIYGPKHPKVRRLKDSLATKQQYMFNLPAEKRKRIQELSRSQIAPQLLQMAHTRLNTAIQHEQQIQRQVEAEKSTAQQGNRQRAKIEELKKEIEHLNEQSIALIERITSIDLERDSGVVSEVVTHPTVAIAPVSPRLSVVGLLSLMLGTCIGLGAIYVMDVMDDRFRSPEELRMQLGTQVLAMVPKMEPLDGECFESVHTFARPNGSESEAFRTLRTSIDFANSETRRIVSTSTEPGDGKTTVTANMAVAFAQSGKRTLLIDADMRRPGMSNMLDLRDSLGLSEILRASDAVDQIALDHVRGTEVDGLDVVSCGPRPVNPSELLASDRFPELLAWAETRYDQILIDAPPVLAVSDPAIIGRLVDGVILVVRPDKDRRRMVIRATDTLKSLGCNLLGVVVNHLSSEDGGDYSYGYGYGYGYGYAYGHEDAEDDVAVEDTGLPETISFDIPAATDDSTGPSVTLGGGGMYDDETYPDEHTNDDDLSAA